MIESLSRRKEKIIMEQMKNLSREQLEKMVDTLSMVLLEIADAQTATMLLKGYGFETEEFEAIGYEVEV